jgi:hypothetical protein
MGLERNVSQTVGIGVLVDDTGETFARFNIGAISGWRA